MKAWQDSTRASCEGKSCPRDEDFKSLINVVYVLILMFYCTVIYINDTKTRQDMTPASSSQLLPIPAILVTNLIEKLKADL